MKTYQFNLSINRAVFSEQEYIKSMEENARLREELKKKNLSNRAYNGWSTKRHKEHNAKAHTISETLKQLDLFQVAC